jgi:hypothetical protein
MVEIGEATCLIAQHTQGHKWQHCPGIILPELVVTVLGDVVEWEASYGGEFKAILRLEESDPNRPGFSGQKDSVSLL